ncbi:MAG: hypothetical protein EOP84_36020, partial [Verrucomicrobiaceae bacterium]
MHKHIARFATLMMLPLLGSSCGTELLGLGASDEVDELGQQMGEIMASTDEMGATTTGTYPLRLQYSKLDSSTALDQLGQWLIADAHAGTCQGGSSFSNCSSNQITRTFGGCTFGGIRADGSITLTWGGGASACTTGGTGSTITRVPNFTLANRRGATLSIYKSGTYGQRITALAGNNYSFESDGIRRSYRSSANKVLLDFST